MDSVQDIVGHLAKRLDPKPCLLCPGGHRTAPLGMQLPAEFYTLWFVKTGHDLSTIKQSRILGSTALTIGYGCNSFLFTQLLK